MGRAGIQKDVRERLIKVWPGIESYVRRRAPRLVSANDTHRGLRPLWSSDLSQDVAVLVLEAAHRGGDLDLSGDNLEKFARHKAKHCIAEESERLGDLKTASLDAFEENIAGPDAKDASTALHFDADGHDVAVSAALATAMLSLTDKQHQAIELHIFEGLTLEECAKRLDLKTSTFSDRHYAALAKLRAVLMLELSKIQLVESWAWAGTGGTRTAPKNSSEDIQ
jgi:RNA polymerase sigma factor (sigma-70 family)